VLEPFIQPLLLMRRSSHEFRFDHAKHAAGRAFA